jgi:hypothetical protein
VIITVNIEVVDDTLRRQIALELNDYSATPVAAEDVVLATDEQVATWCQDNIDNCLDNLHDTFGDS